MTLHMEPQIVERQDWFLVTDGMDSVILPEEFEDNWGESYELDKKFEGKYGVRWSAPGYQDSSSWRLFDTLEGCVQELFDSVNWIKQDNEYGEEAQAVMEVAAGLLEESGRFEVKKHLIEKGYEGINGDTGITVWFVLDKDVEREVFMHPTDAYLWAIGKAEGIPEEYGGLAE